MRKLQLFCICMLACTVAAGFADSDDTLQKAWKEYRFQSFKVADKLFREAPLEGGTAETAWESQLGQACILLFGETLAEPPKAVEAFRTLVKTAPDRTRKALAGNFLAEALFANQNIKDANAQWDTVITEYPDLMVAQDALMRRTYANLTSFSMKENPELLTYMAEKRKTFPTPTPEEPGMAPLFDNLVGKILFWNQEYAQARAAFIRAAEIGSKDTTSYGRRASLLMRIARISEKFLNDPETAGAYYRQFVIETPNDVRSFFALQQALSYGSISPEEAVSLNMNGVTDEVVQKILSERNR